MIRVFLAGAALALLSACATTPPPDPSVMRAAQSRHYDLPPERVTAAAREVLRLSDPQDTRFAETPHGFTAGRDAFIYLVFAASSATYQWQFDVSNSTDAWINVTTNGTPPRERSVYDLFWQRVDYLLGISQMWPTCEGARGTAYIILCDLADDRKPSGPLP